MLSDTNDDFRTPPSSPHLFSLTSPLSSPDLSPSLHHTGFSDLTMDDLDNDNIDHLSSADAPPMTTNPPRVSSSNAPSTSTNYLLFSSSTRPSTSNYPHLIPSVIDSASSDPPHLSFSKTATYQHSSSVPSTSTNISYLPSSTVPSISTSLSLLQYHSELITDGLDNANINQLAERLQILEKLKIDLDEFYYNLQDVIFGAIAKCEMIPGNKIQNQLLNSMKRWTEITTMSDAAQGKAKIGEKLEKLQNLIIENRYPKRKRRTRRSLSKSTRKTPPKLKYLDYIDNTQQQNGTSNNPDMFIRGLDSGQLAEIIQQKLYQGYTTAENQRQIDRLRRQLASQRKDDLENTLKTTNDHAEQQRISALLQQGELYQELQKSMVLAEEHELVANPPKLLTSLTTKHENGSKQLQTQQEPSTISPNISIKLEDAVMDQNIDQRDSKRHLSSPSLSTSSSTFETSSSLRDTLPPTQTSSPSARTTAPSSLEALSLAQNYSVSPLGTSSPAEETSAATRETSSRGRDTTAPLLNASSPKKGTTFLQKSICPLELEGGVCIDGNCQLAHFSDYYSK